MWRDARPGVWADASGPLDRRPGEQPVLVGGGAQYGGEVTGRIQVVPAAAIACAVHGEKPAFPVQRDVGGDAFVLV